jgi:Lar family restriction alleviation protein
MDLRQQFKKLRKLGYDLNQEVEITFPYLLFNSEIALEKLLPCPFCGCKLIDIENPEWGDGGMTDYKYFNASCDNCGARSNEYDTTYEEVIKNWNTRVKIK